MRITQEAKAATGQRILEESARLFRTAGWESTTTREIASAAGIATGTLFNYFSSKEAIAAALIAAALDAVEMDFEGESLEEDLFAFVWTGLKLLRKYRNFASQAAETMFSPLARHASERPGDAIRVRHLETVEALAAAHGRAPLPAITLQLYWTLYLGVFAFWAADASPHQEDTLALLDQSLKLFVASLGKGGDHDERKSR